MYASTDRKFGLLNIIRRTSVPRSILGIVGAGVGAEERQIRGIRIEGIGLGSRWAPIGR